MKPEIKKLLILNLPYLLFVWLFDKVGAAVRLSPGADASAKLLHLGDGFTAAFSSIAPSFHPADLALGIAGAVIVRLIIYTKGKNAKKYRRGTEYGSARWGGADDIKPYTDPVFENNIPLTQTERLTMNSRPKQPKYARNKNILVIGGSGSGKTRFFVKPSLMQCTSKDFPTSYIVTDPKGNLKEMNETFNYLRANGIYSLEDLEHRVSEHSAATESLKKTLDEQTARMKAIKQLYDSSAAFQSLKPVYDGLQKIKFEKPRAKYKAEHEAELKQFYAARRKLTGEFPDGKVDMKKLTEEYDELEQAHNTTYGEFKTVRDDLHRLWKVKSCVDTAARFNERTEEQMLQNRPQTRHKKEDLSR